MIVCKIFFCSDFPNIPEKSWRRRKRWRKPANAKLFAFQARQSTKKSFHTGGLVSKET